VLSVLLFVSGSISSCGRVCGWKNWYCGGRLGDVDRDFDFDRERERVRWLKLFVVDLELDFRFRGFPFDAVRIDTACASFKG
jgi:hypothetical protein